MCGSVRECVAALHLTATWHFLEPELERSRFCLNRRGEHRLVLPVSAIGFLFLL
jgi:hypothetical protein